MIVIVCKDFVDHDCFLSLCVVDNRLHRNIESDQRSDRDRVDWGRLTDLPGLVRDRSLRSTYVLTNPRVLFPS